MLMPWDKVGTHQTIGLASTVRARVTRRSLEGQETPLLLPSNHCPQTSGCRNPVPSQHSGITSGHLSRAPNLTEHAVENLTAGTFDW